MSVILIDSLSISGCEYVTTFLAMQILADFEVKYLPLPERYDLNFSVSLSLNLSFLKSIENIFGYCCLFASGVI